MLLPGLGQTPTHRGEEVQFRIVAARYDSVTQFLWFTASGTSGDARFTVSSKVKCLKDPSTPERLHMAVLLALHDIFRRPSASGHRWT